jgi:aldose 1-epimerase
MNVVGAPVGQVAGEFGGAPVRRFVLRNRTGITASILEYGAILERLLVPDANGATANVVLGLSDLAGYVADSSYFGAVVGRYANRIEHGRFPLDGEVVQLSMNDPDSSVHGGSSGFNRKVWRQPLRVPRRGRRAPRPPQPRR